MAITAKKDGMLRQTVDLQHLKNQCLRETHHCQSLFQLVSQIPPNSYKTVLDMVDGYHAIALDKESQTVTNFITEWGCYMYFCLPQGYLASRDAYTQRYDEMIKDVPRKLKIVDDTLLHDSNIDDLFFHIWE